MNILQERLVKFFFSRRGFFLAFSLYLLILSIFFIQMFGKAYREEGWDFSSYLLSSKAFFDGTNPYNTESIFPFIYPLFVCVLLFPLASLPYWLANTVWFILNVSALYFSAFILFKLYQDSFSHKEIVALCFVPFVVLIGVIQNNLLNGQINFIVLLLCILFLKYYTFKRWKVLASVFLSAAIAIKLMPLILIVYLIAKREFMLAIITVIFSIFFALGLPYVIRGGITFEWYSEYVHSFLMQNIAFHRALSDDFGFSITSIINFLLPVPKITSLAIASFISVAPVFWFQINLSEDTVSKQILFFSIYMLAILLIVPMSQTHHLINLLPAVSLVTFAMLFHGGSNFKMGIFTLSIVFISLFARKLHLAIAIVSILALYSWALWIYFNSRKQTTAHNSKS